LFAALKDDNLLDEKRKDLMLFLKEFCVFSQTLQQQNRDNFFQVRIQLMRLHRQNYSL
ncbi:unnamed protein product, partial [Rotaria magnacalcarata]